MNYFLIFKNELSFTLSEKWFLYDLLGKNSISFWLYFCSIFILHRCSGTSDIGAFNKMYTLATGGLPRREKNLV